MSIKSAFKKLSLLQASCLVAAIAFPIGVYAQSQTDGVTISQKNRKYSPKAVTLKKGDSLNVVNDDIFLHHAFIKSDDMEFDSGSMEEGDSAKITFETSGQYQLKCAIHPKMKLDITVE
jgi:plastocyanin